MKQSFGKLEMQREEFSFWKIRFPFPLLTLFIFSFLISFFFSKKLQAKQMFWLQDQDATKDPIILTTVNRFLSGSSPPPALPLPRINQGLAEPSPREPLPPAATLDSPAPQRMLAANAMNMNLMPPIRSAQILQQILQNTLVQLGVDSGYSFFIFLLFPIFSLLDHIF
jgi:hypothetical protein